MQSGRLSGSCLCHPQLAPLGRCTSPPGIVTDSLMPWRIQARAESSPGIINSCLLPNFASDVKEALLSFPSTNQLKTRAQKWARGGWSSWEFTLSAADISEARMFFLEEEVSARFLSAFHALASASAGVVPGNSVLLRESVVRTGCAKEMHQK